MDVVCFGRQPLCFVVFRIVDTFVLTQKEQSPNPFWETNQTPVSHISKSVSIMTEVIHLQEKS